MGNLFTPSPIILKLLGIFDAKSLVPLLFLLAYSQLSNCQYGWNDKPCAVLYSAENYEGLNFTLNDRDQSIDLAGDHRGPDSGWNATGSLVIERDCGLTVCNESYLDGDCQTLSSGSYPNSVSGLNIASALCNCDEECKCSGIYMRRSSCARAYLKGGCSACHSEYIELRGKEDYMGEDFIGKVKALRIRKGCALTLYSEEELEGETTVFDAEIVENYQGEFQSYKCECDDKDFEPRVKPPRQTSYPPLIDIPEKLDDLIKMLAYKNFSTHPGLRAAYMSLKKGRSSKNAYILILGSTGSGKSSAIDLIFNKPQMNMVHPGQSTTNSAILEYRLAVPVDELGVRNSEIRVIEVPGLSDTRGIQQDAANLATLDLFLSNHEELNDRIPNVVLIFHKFNDNRFNGQGSNFLKMLQGLDILRDRITDENYSNVIFVLSHFGSETRRNQRRPDVRLSRFKSAIDNYSLFPQPITITVAENRAKEQDFPMVDGHYKLPNNEYYPKNLFEKIELVTKKGGDMFGLRVLNSAFRGYPDTDFNVTSINEYSIPKRSPKTDYYLRLLSNVWYTPTTVPTEVSQKLQQIWNDPEKIKASLKLRFPNSLAQLQRALHRRHVNTLEDVPRTTNEILKLLPSIKQDEVTRQLLKKGLNTEIPIFPQSTIVGFGYDVFKDQYVSISPFKLDNVKGSDIGFLVPDGLKCELEQNPRQHFHVFDNREEYIQHRLQVLGVEWTIPNETFRGTIKPSYNIKNVGLKPDGCSLTAIREYRLFQFTLNDEVELSQEFVESVRKLPAFNQGDCKSLEKWRTFFSDYGTHVVKSIHGGGAIQIQLQSDKPYDHDLVQVMFDLVQFAEDLSLSVVNTEGHFNNTTVYGNITHSLTFKGGDHAYYTSDLTMMSLKKASELLKNWKKSLKFNPELLTTEMKLLPISQIVRKLGQNYSTEIEQATSVLFETGPISNSSEFERRSKKNNERRLREFQQKLKELNDALMEFEKTMQKEASPEAG